MISGDQITINGITYGVTIMGENIHGRGTVVALNKIGRGGKATKAERPALITAAGTIEVGRWL
tara:strand:+ start:500 stop:688 length:189 start_codon:yes stop_codon:yes gene_type:complete